MDRPHPSGEDIAGNLGNIDCCHLADGVAVSGARPSRGGTQEDGDVGISTARVKPCG